jgi:hypothetical protein
MATAKVTKAVDEITPKTGLRVAHSAPTGYKQDYGLGELEDEDFITKKLLEENTPEIATPKVYNLPANSETPVIINFDDSTVKIGAASPVSIGFDLSDYQANPDIKFEIITSSLNTTPKDTAAWISNKEWFDITYSSLVELTLQPDTDTGISGGLTLDNINIIIKP